MSAAFLYSYLESPVGRILLAGDGEALHFISFPGGRTAMKPLKGWRCEDAPFKAAQTQLTEYFNGERRDFDLLLTFEGTVFQKRVWAMLMTIPFGETRSYGWLAEALGAGPQASRAVGAANGANPLPIIAPCHRVVGADGSLTGFGGGLETKRFLLALEGAKNGGDERQLDLF